MRMFIALFFAFFTTIVTADTIAPPLPALYGVAGVDAGEVLNIRAAPDASEPIIGTIAAGASNIEVVDLSREGNWALVNTGEGAGWAAIRYLIPQPVTTNALGLPVGLQCFGTEPFWDITFGDDLSLTMRTSEGATTHPITANAPASGNVSLAQTGFRFDWHQDRATVTARILPGQCSDGMSDRRYGLHYVDDQNLRTGCCSLQ